MSEPMKLEKVLKMNEAQYRKDNLKRNTKLMAEPKVGVYGNPLYKASLGSSYTFTYNDNPVCINFDGKTYMYPKTIAILLQKKLDAAARAGTPKEISESVIL